MAKNPHGTTEVIALMKPEYQMLDPVMGKKPHVATVAEVLLPRG